MLSFHNFFNRFWINCSSFNLLWKKTTKISILDSHLMWCISCANSRAKQSLNNIPQLMLLRDKPFQVIFKGKGVVGQFLPCKFFLADSICRNIFRNIPLAGIFLTSMFFHIFLPQPTRHELIIRSQAHRNSYGNSCCVIHWFRSNSSKCAPNFPQVASN